MSKLTKIYGSLDAGIKDIVLLLRKNGYDTISSCHGGRGHQSYWPKVWIMNSNEENLVAFLKAQGYNHFMTKLCTDHSVGTNIRRNWIELEFLVSPPA